MIKRNGYPVFIFDVRTQVAICHEREDDHWFLLISEAETEEREDVRVVEVLHDDPLLQEVLHNFMVQVRI